MLYLETSRHIICSSLDRNLSFLKSPYSTVATPRLPSYRQSREEQLITAASKDQKAIHIHKAENVTKKGPLRQAASNN